MKFKKSKSVFLFSLIVLFGTNIGQSFAQGVITFGPEEASIDGSIPYSVLGHYRARFTDFKGRLTLDKNLQRIQSVYLKIQVNSIHSNCPWCDKIVRSKRLLNTARYPEIIFKSYKVIQDKGMYKVKGVLEMHGVKKKIIFPFKVEISNDQKAGQEMLNLKGSWTINRKDFHVIWSKLLDRGGVLVGDNFTVHWRTSFLVYKRGEN
jgi:polyisoprenoid-binding protein YceI